jgi:PAS domain S-box-containing protein
MHEKKIKELENRFRMIIDNANDGIIIHEPAGRILDVNQSMYDRLGYTKEEMLKMSLNDLVSQEYEGKIEQRAHKLEKNGVAIFESADQRKDGTVMPVEVSARYIDYNGKKAILSVVRDISERKLAENLISSTMREMDMMLEEIKHRTVTNLNTISESIKYFARDIKDERLASRSDAIRERIDIMTFIHNRIYRLKSFSNIDMPDIIRELTAYLFSMHESKIIPIKLKTEINDISLDIQKALPCCLIISELVTNSINHAFPEGRSGKIAIKMIKDEKETCMLTVKDDGIGLPEEIDLNQSSTFGLILVKALVDQIKGIVELNKHDGTEYTIQF